VNLAWDKAELESISDQVEGFDVGDFGFEIDDLPQVVMPTDEQGDGEGKPQTEVKEDDFDPDAHYETKVKAGEVWQLGEHRLMCGDSTDADAVAKLMNGERADLVFTDPPYGISTKGGRQQTFAKRGMTDIENDNRIGEDLVGFLTAVFNAMPLADDASVYVCYPWKTQAEFTEAIRQSGLTLKACIVWDKKVFGLNGSQHGYRPQHELIYFACKGNYKWYGDKSQSDIWQVSREINREEQGNHPTPKPVALCGKAIVNSSTGTDIVLDVFGGSGSTMIACEQLGRKCRMMELDPHYCTVIIARWEKLTGLKAVKLNE
jgi:DNA modification methylase